MSVVVAGGAIVASAGMYLLIVRTLPSYVIVALCVVLISLASSSFEGLEPYSLAFRVVALAVLGLQPRDIQRRGKHATAAVPSQRWDHGHIFLVGLFVYIFSGTIPHLLVAEFIMQGLGLILLVWSASRAHRALGPDAILRGVVTGLALVLVVSVGSAVMFPTVAWENGRLRGVVENANFLGFLAMLWLVLSLPRRRRVLGVLWAPVTLSILLLSASRTSALALILASIVVLIRSERALMKVAWTVLGIGVVACVLMLVGAPDLEMLRVNNSRAGGADDAWHVLRGTQASLEWGSTMRGCRRQDPRSVSRQQAAF